MPDCYGPSRMSSTRRSSADVEMCRVHQYRNEIRQKLNGSTEGDADDSQPYELGGEKSGKKKEKGK